jgi:hypothetical protein
MSASQSNLDRKPTEVPLAAASLIALAFVGVACGRQETTASRSAAAYDEAQRKGTPLDKGAGHGGHAVPAGEKQAEAVPADSHAQHGAPAASSNAATHSDHSRMPGMDHRPKPGSGGHGPHVATGVQDSDKAGMQHSKPAATDHAAMGHGTPPPPSPEAAVASAQAGQPAATLKADDIDAPAATSLREAERASALAREMPGGHMQHGTPYKQLDAGRGDDPKPAEDPHAMHRPPAPRPSPSPTPTPKPSPHRHEGF